MNIDSFNLTELPDNIFSAEDEESSSSCSQGTGVFMGLTVKEEPVNDGDLVLPTMCTITPPDFRSLFNEDCLEGLPGGLFPEENINTCSMSPTDFTSLSSGQSVFPPDLTVSFESPSTTALPRPSKEIFSVKRKRISGIREETKEQKKHRRLIKNREAAQRTRDFKKATAEWSENEIKRLNTENTTLKTKNSRLLEYVSTFEKRLEEFRVNNDVLRCALEQSEAKTVKLERDLLERDEVIVRLRTELQKGDKEPPRFEGYADPDAP